MDYARQQQDLNTALESEILGELLFQTAANFSLSSSKRHKWQLLAQLETQTLERLQQFLATSLQQAEVRHHVKLQARISGVILAQLPWKLSMYLLKRGTLPFIIAFERLNQHAQADSKVFLQYLLAHEQAIAEFAKREIQGEENSLAPVLSLLGT